jgi:hypothetical protein
MDLFISQTLCKQRYFLSIRKLPINLYNFNINLSIMVELKII